ncbi:MAG TPA: PAS domain S-box protein [Terriglobales bacterium]|nr:PAS domain S-box protein [Terriglobales bacterium]
MNRSSTPARQVRKKAESADPRAKNHTVHFYQSDSALIESLTRIIGAALGGGGATIIIATAAHRQALDQRLRTFGVDLALAKQQQRYVAVDAAETLARITIHDWPDADRFKQVIPPILAQARASVRSEDAGLVAFGEMVALLCADGKADAAIRLEQLWNDLANTDSFHLHCAYSMSLFPRGKDIRSIEEVCAQHSNVVPAESYTNLGTAEERLSGVAVLQQRAQALETEIAHRKSIQQALQLREAELREFLENAVIGMHWIAADGTILWANKAELEMLGYSREEYIGQQISSFHADQDVAADILARLARNEELRGYDARMKSKDGSIRFVRFDSNVFLQDGKFTHRCFSTDITERKKAEVMRSRLAAIVESSDDAIASKDLDGIVTSWNASAERMFGYKAEEIIGKPVTLIIPPELQQDEPMILSKIRRGEKIDHFETVRITKNGERLDVSLTVSPVKDEHGEVVGAAKIVRNITDQKRIERALRTTEKLAAAGRLAATVAHEINNPLEAVTNLVYLAQREAAGARNLEQYLQLASRELERVAHIARQTLAFYRESSSTPNHCNLGQILDELLRLYQTRIESRGIKLSKQYANDIEIKAMAGELRHAFSNLITNAIDAMPAGGSLVIRASKRHEWHNSHLPGVRLTFLDTGCGIESQYRKYLFEPFFTTKDHIGTGLGLWITQGIITKHGGSIRMKSSTAEENRGTVFSIFLPEEPARPKSPAADPIASSLLPAIDAA